MMTATLEQVFKDVSYLSIREKALVAHCLIASLDTAQDDDIDSAWAGLAEKRFFELISGKVKTISWDEIKRGLKK
jgi:hypothetical protein